jgi:hypothetical protein
MTWLQRALKHPSKYLHEDTCIGKDIGGGVCDCRRVGNPRWFWKAVIDASPRRRRHQRIELLEETHP